MSEDPARPRARGLAAALAAWAAAPDGPDAPGGPPGGPHPLLTAVGGVRGLLDSALPTTAFVIAIAVTDLGPAVLWALAAAVLVIVVRAVRREPLQQAVSGLLGVAVAALVALLLHRKSGYFLPGLLMQAGYAIALVVSVLAGRPVLGYVAAIADTRLARWREHRALRRAATGATLLWVAIFGARLAVQGPLYLADESGWLGATKLAMGWPLWAVGVSGSVWLIRRAARRSGIYEPIADDLPVEQPAWQADQDAPSARPN